MPEVSQFRWPRPGSWVSDDPREHQARRAARRSGQVDPSPRSSSHARPGRQADHPGRARRIGDIIRRSRAIRRLGDEFQPLDVPTGIGRRRPRRRCTAGTRRSWPGSGRCPARTTARASRPASLWSVVPMPVPILQEGAARRRGRGDRHAPRQSPGRAASGHPLQEGEEPVAAGIGIGPLKMDASMQIRHGDTPGLNRSRPGCGGLQRRIHPRFVGRRPRGAGMVDPWERRAAARKRVRGGVVRVVHRNLGVEDFARAVTRHPGPRRALGRGLPADGRLGDPAADR